MASGNDNLVANQQRSRTANERMQTLAVRLVLDIVSKIALPGSA